MAKPITPIVSCDVFVLNARQEVLLIQRADNGLWAIPGGCHDLGETPKACAERECLEETGYSVQVTGVLGVFSSNCYEYLTYPFKDTEFCHLVFYAKLISGQARPSHETLDVGWFAQKHLPKLSDGHAIRLEVGFASINNPAQSVYFE